METKTNIETAFNISDSVEAQPVETQREYDYKADIHTIKNWVQFFGVLTIISMVISILCVITALN